MCLIYNSYYCNENETNAIISHKHYKNITVIQIERTERTVTVIQIETVIVIQIERTVTVIQIETMTVIQIETVTMIQIETVTVIQVKRTLNEGL